MGYWDVHPMAGDDPLDALGVIDFYLFSKEEYFLYNFNDPDNLAEFLGIYRKRLLSQLHEAPHLEFPKEQTFVLPYIVCEFQIQIRDEVLSQRIKRMIRDGGASFRGYRLLKSTKENSYNHFQSPYDYACQLRDLWGDLMSGEVRFDELAHQRSFFEVILDEDNAGLINVD